MDIRSLAALIEKYLIDNPTSRAEGRLTNKEEFLKLDPGVLKNIPGWYQDILVNFPLVGLEVGIPNDFGDEELIGRPREELPLMGLTFISVERMAYCTLNLYPDVELVKLNHIRIAEDRFGTQQGIYIDFTEDDPSPKLVFHIFDTGRDALDEAEILLPTFTDIFKYGKKRNLREE
jgi:hypothetical protein